MSITPKRWFASSTVEPIVKQLMSEVAEAGLNPSPPDSARYSERQTQSLNLKTYFFLAAVGLFIGAVLFVPDFLPGEWLAKTENSAMIVKFIVVAVPIGMGVAAKKRLGRATKRLEKHDTCVQQFVDQYPDLCCTHASAISSSSVQTIPMMDSGYHKSNLRCGLFGEYNSHALALLEAEYMAPHSINMANTIAHLQANLAKDPDKEQFSRVRSGEAVIFFQPLHHLPDLFLCGTEEPLCQLMKNWVKKAGGIPAESTFDLGDKIQGFSSCIETAIETVALEVYEILKLRPKAMVQVIGGHVVVFPRTWSAATPMEMAVTAFDIQLDLEFASAIYEKLASTANQSQLENIQTEQVLA